jgi:hypothetical protein
MHLSCFRAIVLYCTVRINNSFGFFTSRSTRARTLAFTLVNTRRQDPPRDREGVPRDGRHRRGPGARRDRLGGALLRDRLGGALLRPRPSLGRIRPGMGMDWTVCVGLWFTQNKRVCRLLHVVSRRVFHRSFIAVAAAV